MTASIDLSNKEFKNALDLIERSNQSVFLTGRAGTGKSTFLRYLCQTTRKKHVVLAPTGIAAINAEGSTLHSFFKLPFRPIAPDDADLSLIGGRIFEFFKYRKEHRKIIQEVELIIVDEISMVRADTIDCIDRILRVYSNNMRTPFGGKQLVFVGDVFQLEPVITPDTKEVIIATNATSDGEASAMYLARMIKPAGIKVTRLARGLAVGSDIEYADEVTLSKAVENRLEL